MAQVDNHFRPMEVYWTTEGVNDPGNCKPVKMKSKVKGRKTKEVKATIPSKQPLVQDLTPKKMAHNKGHEDDRKSELSSNISKASLKDLCAEDKQRVANLVKELARVGDERENALRQAETERQVFEGQIKELVQQQDQILKEREGVREQLSQCQSLLARYQERLAVADPGPASSTTRKTAVAPQGDLDAGTRTAAGPDELDPDDLDPESTRPFTKLIDTLIAKENLTASQTNELGSSDIVRIGDAGRHPGTAGHGRGMAGAPSECSRVSGSHPPSGGPSLEHPAFRGLPQQETRSVHHQSGRMPYHVSGNNPEFVAPHLESLGYSSSIPEEDLLVNRAVEFSDPGFIEQYKQMSAMDRKKELLVQKRALIEEQQRLKFILAEQEAMLQLKQKQLDKQHLLQQNRLQHFEVTGSFPAHAIYAQRVQTQDPMAQWNPFQPGSSGPALDQGGMNYMEPRAGYPPPHNDRSHLVPDPGHGLHGYGHPYQPILTEQSLADANGYPDSSGGFSGVPYAEVGLQNPTDQRLADFSEGFSTGPSSVDATRSSAASSRRMDLPTGLAMRAPPQGQPREDIPLRTHPGGLAPPPVTMAAPRVEPAPAPRTRGHYRNRERKKDNRMPRTRSQKAQEYDFDTTGSTQLADLILEMEHNTQPDVVGRSHGNHPVHPHHHHHHRHQYSNPNSPLDRGSFSSPPTTPPSSTARPRSPAPRPAPNPTHLTDSDAGSYMEELMSKERGAGGRGVKGRGTTREAGGGHRGVGRRQGRGGEEDPEESQILDDIFFVQ